MADQGVSQRQEGQQTHWVPPQDHAALRAAMAAANPSAPDPYVVLGDARRIVGDTKRALAAYRQALDRGSREAHVYVAMGELLIETGRASEAIRWRL